MKSFSIKLREAEIRKCSNDKVGEMDFKVGDGVRGRGGM